MFVADDLGAWLVELIADAGRKKLTMLLLGTDQERALRQAAKAAIEATAEQLAPSSDEQAKQLAMVIGEVFRDPQPDAKATGQMTLLEALQAGIVRKLAVLDDPDITGAGESSAELLMVPGGILADTLADRLIREIMLRGSRGGPLAPLADQLNHDATHLQGRRLEGMLTQLANSVMALAQVGAPEAPRKPVRLSPRPTFLAGREELLAGLDIRLTSGDIAGPQTVALYGLGGTGKTSVAVEYAYRHLAEVAVAWQFAAEDNTVLAAEFGELAAQLGAKDVADTRDPVASVHAMLAMLAAPWLLIFDNAEDLASVAAFLPPAGPGRVLITSQNSNWPYGQALHVPLLGTEVAVDFLVSRTGELDRQAARDLADVLGGLPLALEQAAAYILATGGSLAGYLALFQQRRTVMLARGKPTGYDKTLATTWTLAFDHLQQTAPAAVSLLRLLVSFAPETIPLRLLLQPRPGLAGRLGDEVGDELVPLLEDPLAVGDAIAALRRYSLITLGNAATVSLHRLVQAVTADHMPAGLAREWQQAAATLITAAIPSDTGRPETWPVCAALLPHAQAALSDDNVGVDLVANYLGSSGSYATARNLQRRVFDAREKGLGPEHWKTLTARHQLAHWTGEAGDPAAARDMYAELLPVQVRVYGPEHPDILAIRHQLALWTAKAGDPAAARDMYAELLPAQEQVYGPEHPFTLKTRHELARTTAATGDLAARDLFAELLLVRERVSGPQHPDTLVVQQELAHWTGEAGDRTAARDLFAELVPVYEQILGPEHPDTLNVRHQLAHWTGEAGDSAAARDSFAELMPTLEQVLGPEHPDSLVTRSSLVDWTWEAGDEAAAQDMCAELLPALEQVLGPEHPDTLNVRSKFADRTGLNGDPAGAEDLLADLLPVLERILGPQHSHTLTVKHQIAHWTGLAGNPSTARDMYAELLPVHERILGRENPHTLNVRANLAFWTGLAGDPAAARDSLADLLPVLERILGAEHPDSVTVCHQIAYWTKEAETGR
jgi:hypothetical protein